MTTITNRAHTPRVKAYTGDARNRLVLDIDQMGRRFITIEVSHQTETEIEHLARFLEAAANLIIVKGNEAAANKLDALVQVYSTDLPIPRYMAKEAEMIAKAKEEVIRATTWLTGPELSKLAGLQSSNLSAQPAKWKAEKKIFSIRHGGADLFPAYAIDTQNNCRPVKGLQPILKLFGGYKDSWGLAYWFAGLNSFLGGKRPQDFLQINPELVLAAAKDELAGVEHG